MRQEFGEPTVAAFGYRRHTDEFILLRDKPSVYENNHIDSSWQASLRHTIRLQAHRCRSSALRLTATAFTRTTWACTPRNRGAGYIDFELRPSKRRWNLSAGAREEIFSGGGRAAFAPQLSGTCALRMN